jgi:hypothetical protein
MDVIRKNQMAKVSVWIMALTFFVAASGKVGSSEELRDSLYASYLFSSKTADWFSPILVMLEFGTGICLCLRGTRRAATWAATIAFSLFAAYNVWRLVAHIEAPCSCFGWMLRVSPGLALLINCGLLCLSVFSGIAAQSPVIRTSVNIFNST